MAKTKKIEVVKVGTAETPEGPVAVYTDCKTALRALLTTKIPTVFDREPNSSYNSNLDKLVDEIDSLYS